jgi:pSer/pThr/pTyr-binding forkhead associated (FHA) protein
MNTTTPHFALCCHEAPYIQFSLSKPITVLGRSSSCDLVLNALSISRRHAELRIVESGLEIVDLGSRYGTFVANMRIQGCKVNPGDLIRFGNISFNLVISDSLEKEETNDPDILSKDTTCDQVNPWQVPLSGAEQRVFKLIVGGLPEKMIANQLGLSPHTVHSHTRTIFRSFGVHSRTQLITLFSQRIDK